MKRSEKSTGARAALAAALLLAAVSGCAKDDGTVVVIGTGNGYPPYCYLDPSGDLAGFERDLLDAVDRKLEAYKFRYEILEFKNILASLDAGRVDLAAHQYAVNDERRQKYLFAEEGYGADNRYLVVAPGTEGIASFDDLAGKIISVAPGSESALEIETWNRGHPGGEIQILYYEATPDILVTNLLTGVIDATIRTEQDVKLINTFWPNAHLKIVGESIGGLEEAYYIYRKESVALRDAVDGALRELKESGELDALHKKALDVFFKNAVVR
ncbi:MAG: transporter substrate-binding domain-containing protein [Treponema sp.]|jgi:L-cystine transport system substrate-binding protein|nr:transporter substrate-binding domain-containing protein [Treponema sp.]